MDPYEALRIIREARAELFSEGEPYDPETVRTLIETLDGLDTWLTKGGFLPSDWERPTVEDNDEDPTIRCRDCEHPLHQRAEKALSGEVAIVWADQHDAWVCDETGNEHRPGVRA